MEGLLFAISLLWCGVDEIKQTKKKEQEAAKIHAKFERKFREFDARQEKRRKEHAQLVEKCNSYKQN